MKKTQGFTLIEVMIVVVIVAILAAVAVPSYQDSVRKTRRADAKEALTRIAAAQERYFFTNNSYGTLFNLGLVPDVGTLIVGSTEGHYNIALVGGLTCAGSPCFRITATATGAQASDTRCASLSLNHIGQKTANASDNAVTTDYCW
jgi:type IV pilus assembly protein PilE